MICPSLVACTEENAAAEMALLQSCDGCRGRWCSTCRAEGGGGDRTRLTGAGRASSSVGVEAEETNGSGMPACCAAAAIWTHGSNMCLQITQRELGNCGPEPEAGVFTCSLVLARAPARGKQNYYYLCLIPVEKRFF